MSASRLSPINLSVSRVHFLIHIACVLFLSSSVAFADYKKPPFRYLGPELMDIAVMESDAVLDVRKVNFSEGRIDKIIYAKEDRNISLRAGTPISLDPLPSLSVPTFSGPELTATEIAPSASSSYYDRRFLRVLMFLQPDVGLTRERYQLSSVDFEKTLFSENVDHSNKYRPFFVLGGHSYYWFGLYEKDVNGRVPEWESAALIQNLAKILLQSKNETDRLATLRKGRGALASKFNTRLYQLPGSMKLWDGVLESFSAAIKKRRAFDHARSSVPHDEKARFLVSEILDERVYANYAIEEYRKFGSPQFANYILATRNKLKYFVDDVWETAAYLHTKKRITPNLVRLRELSGVLEDIVPSVCGDLKKGRDAFREAAKRLGNPQSFLGLGFVSLDKALPVISKLYDAEFQCLAFATQTSKADYQSGVSFSAYQEVLSIPENRGLSIDEAGLFSSVSGTLPDSIREKQMFLKNNFVAELSRSVLESYARVPHGLRELASYCGLGVRNYADVAYPDLTRGQHFVWSYACEQLKTFKWPYEYCPVVDSRLRREVYTFARTYVEVISQAIENDDSVLLQSAWNELTKVPSVEKGNLVAGMLRETNKFAHKPLRRDLLKDLSRLPFLSVARTLAKEYVTRAGPDVLPAIKEIRKTLNSMTGKEPSIKDRVRRYIVLLNELFVGRQPQRGLPSVETSDLRDAINRPSCNNLEIGWTNKWKKERL